LSTLASRKWHSQKTEKEEKEEELEKLVELTKLRDLRHLRMGYPSKFPGMGIQSGSSAVRQGSATRGAATGHRVHSCRVMRV
jgi:hypothetical protein